MRNFLLSRKAQKGQSLVEIGPIILVLIMLLFLYTGVLIFNDVKVSMDSATSLAASSAASTPPNAANEMNTYAHSSFCGTVPQTYSYFSINSAAGEPCMVNQTGIVISCQTGAGALRRCESTGYTQGDKIYVQATGRLLLAKTAVAVLSVATVTITSTSVVSTSVYRSP